MKAFISYAREQQDMAQRLALGLRKTGHSVFLDRDTLPAGESFDDRIRAAIRQAHVFLFLVTSDSLRHGAYTMSELTIAQERWPHPAGRVIPVLVEDVPIDAIPAYLRSVSILEPKGDVVADVLDVVARLDEQRRTVLFRRVGIPTLLVLLAAGVWWWFLSPTGPAIDGTARRESSGYALDLKIENGTRDALTILDASASGDDPAAEEARRMFEPISLKPGETNSVDITTAWSGGASPSKWKACLGYVVAADWDRLKPELAQVRDKNVFIGGVNTADAMRRTIADRYRRQVCTSWKALPQ